MDCDGKFDYLQQFSLYMQNNGFMVIAESKMDTLLDVNIKPPKSYPNNIILRACHYGRPIETTITQNGITYRALQVIKRFMYLTRTEQYNCIKIACIKNSLKMQAFLCSYNASIFDFHITFIKNFTKLTHTYGRFC